MEKARPAVIARALASSATPPVGRARIRCRLLKHVIPETTFAAPWHGRARPLKKHTPSKASCACLFQAAASHSAAWAGRRTLFSITNLLSLSCFFNSQDAPESILRYIQTHISALPIHAGRNCQELNRERERERNNIRVREREMYLASERKRKRQRETHNRQRD